MHHLQQDAKEHGAAEVFIVFKQRPAALFQLKAFANFIQFVLRLSAGITQLFQYLARLLMAIARSQPARAIRQEEHADQQQYRRDGDHAQHPAPGAGIAECGIRQVGRQNANGNHQLIHRDHAAANFLRGNFRQINRRGIRSHPHRQSKQHARNQQDFHVGSRG
ncbi:hypothetical protein D3C72_1388640 [compost metagenome]